uniref:Uncharacterized protein n=1 Tax=Anguilla anguilla TaxID=7936 RepID=A0A0E9V2E3_ANGAN
MLLIFERTYCTLPSESLFSRM